MKLERSIVINETLILLKTELKSRIGDRCPSMENDYMDVIKKTKPIYKHRKYIFIVVFSLFLALTLLFTIIAGEQTPSVDKSELIMATVNKGDLNFTVSGYGRLGSRNHQSVTSPVSATVAKIYSFPGDMLNKNDPIVLLENPDIEHEATKAKLELLVQRANLRQLRLNQKREMLDESIDISQTRSDINAINLRFEAQRKLVAEGIVSLLAFKESEIKKMQLQALLNIREIRIESLTEVHKEAINIQLEMLSQAEYKYQLAHDKINSLLVKSKIIGVQQSSNISIGQRVNTGDEIAHISSSEKLFATLKVPQNIAHKVEVGQLAKITSGHQSVRAYVSRINPKVENNYVSIELDLVDSEEVKLRPSMNVEGEIQYANIKSMTYVEQPFNAQENRWIRVFKVDEETSIATAVDVEFGRKNGRYIEIKSGLDNGETIILSDLGNKYNKIEEVETVRLN